MAGKPYKVWSADRSVRKSLVAKSLTEVLEKGCHKLGYDLNKPLTLVMEEDGTEVDDEEYFSCLDQGCVFLLLRDGEKWRPLRHSAGEDMTDSCTAPNSVSDQGLDRTDGIVPSRSLDDLIQTIKSDLSKIITFSNEEMELVASAPEERVCRISGISLQEAQHLQLTCQRYLDDRTRALEAMDLLKLVAKGQGHGGGGVGGGGGGAGGDAIKRARMDP